MDITIENATCHQPIKTQLEVILVHPSSFIHMDTVVQAVSTMPHITMVQAVSTMPHITMVQAVDTMPHITMVQALDTMSHITMVQALDTMPHITMVQEVDTMSHITMVGAFTMVHRLCELETRVLLVDITDHSRITEQ